MTIPSQWNNIADWQRQVAGPVTQFTQGYVWNQYSSAPSPDPNEGYSYYDLTLGKPGWFDGTDYRYPLAEDSNGDVTVSNDLTVTGDIDATAADFSSLGVSGTSTLGTTSVGALTIGGNVTGSILTTGAIGWRDGGGSVTQGTSRTTAVTINQYNGRIILFNTAGSTAWQSFTVNNNRVSANDTIIVNQRTGTDKYMTLVTAVANGAFEITFATTGGTTSEAPQFGFAVLDGVIS